MKTFVFPCGGLQSRQPEGDEIVIPLNVQETSNVKLQIADISRAMVSSVPDLLLDLLEIAAYVYCADQRAGRGTALLANAGSDWCREMRFTIPVRHPEIWKQPQVSDALAETLGFLSGDVYEFHFNPFCPRRHKWTCFSPTWFPRPSRSRRSRFFQAVWTRLPAP